MAIKMRILYASNKKKMVNFANEIKAKYELAFNSVDVIPPAYPCDKERIVVLAISAKGELYVFVDECHRTQSGKLHKAMTAILPNAKFIGFTGTPLLKKDKKTSLEVFGGYIHTYKFDEGVRDGVILDLRYEARDIPQELTSQEKMSLI